MAVNTCILVLIYYILAHFLAAQKRVKNIYQEELCMADYRILTFNQTLTLLYLFDG